MNMRRWHLSYIAAEPDSESCIMQMHLICRISFASGALKSFALLINSYARLAVR